MNSLEILSELDKFKYLFVDFNIQTVRNFFLLIYCILECLSCCIYKCCDKIPGTATRNAKYKRLICLFKAASKPAFIRCICLILQCLLPKENGLTPLIMDRTNWKIGEKHVNVLAIGILIHNQIFIPICWIELGSKRKRGNSNYKDRKALIKKFLDLMGTDTRNFVLIADREFIGTEWFKYLNSCHLQFIVRFRKTMYMNLLSKHLGVSKKQVLILISASIIVKGYYCCPIQIEGTECNITIVANEQMNIKDPYVFLISNMFDYTKVSYLYRLRWKIEVCFKHLKSNGFNLEEMNLDKPEKIELLIAALALLYALCVIKGYIENQTSAIPIKKYKNGKVYLAISYFRIGLYRVLQENPNLFQWVISIQCILQDAIIQIDKKTLTEKQLKYFKSIT